MLAWQKAERDSNKLTNHVRTEMSVSCHFCGMNHSVQLDHEVENLTEFVNSLYRDGWREITSRAYNVVSIACPECVSKKSSR